MSTEHWQGWVIVCIFATLYELLLNFLKTTDKKIVILQDIGKRIVTILDEPPGSLTFMLRQGAREWGVCFSVSQLTRVLVFGDALSWAFKDASRLASHWRLARWVSHLGRQVKLGVSVVCFPSFYTLHSNVVLCEMAAFLLVMLWCVALINTFVQSFMWPLGCGNCTPLLLGHLWLQLRCKPATFV